MFGEVVEDLPLPDEVLVCAYFESADAQRVVFFEQGLVTFFRVFWLACENFVLLRQTERILLQQLLSRVELPLLRRAWLHLLLDLVHSAVLASSHFVYDLILLLERGPHR